MNSIDSKSTVVNPLVAEAWNLGVLAAMTTDTDQEVAHKICNGLCSLVKLAFPGHADRPPAFKKVEAFVSDMTVPEGFSICITKSDAMTATMEALCSRAGLECDDTMTIGVAL